MAKLGAMRRGVGAAGAIGEPVRIAVGAWVRVAVCASLCVTACLGCGPQREAPVEPPTIRIATGPSGGTYLRLGEAFAAICERQWPDVRARAEATEGSVSNAKALHERRADVAFMQADVAYAAYRKGSALRAVAALYTNALQIITRADGPVRDIPSLAGRRVGVGPSGSGTGLTADIVMNAHGLNGRVDRRALTFADAVAQVRTGDLDAAFVMASFPTDVITHAGAGLRLLSVDAKVMSTLRTTHPFYRPIVIPGGTYAGQSADVRTLGVDNVLACRSDLDDEVARRVTQLLLESLRELAAAHPSAGTIDPEQAPAAPIPLHPGAKRFYRARELFR